MLAQIILVLSLTALALYLVVVLTKVKSVLGRIETDIREISVRVVPVLDNMEVITSKLRTIMANVDDQMIIVKNSVQSIKEVADNILDFERRVQETIETPVLEVAGVLGSIVRGISAFINRLRG